LKQLAVNIFKFYIFINIHVALSVVALYLIFNPDYNAKYLGFLFFSSIAGYNFIRFFNFRGNRFFIKKFIAKYKFPVFTSILLSILLSLYFYLQLDFITQVALLPFLLMSFFYNYNYKYAPFFKLRNNGIVKILSVAIVWSGLVILVPASERGMLEFHHFLKFIWVCFYVLMLTLSFDQRDLYIDDSELRTIPQLYGEKLATIYVLITLVLSVLSLYIFDGKKLFTGLIILIISAFAGYHSNEDKSYYYTAFWIEALPVFWLLFIHFIA